MHWPGVFCARACCWYFRSHCAAHWSRRLPQASAGGKRTAGSAKQQKCSTAGCVSRRLWGWQESATRVGWLDTFLLPTAALGRRRQQGRSPAGRSAPHGSSPTTMQDVLVQVLLACGLVTGRLRISRVACIRWTDGHRLLPLPLVTPSRRSGAPNPAAHVEEAARLQATSRPGIGCTSSIQPQTTSLGLKHEAAPNAARQRSAATAIAVLMQATVGSSGVHCNRPACCSIECERRCAL